jgi:hypothetical protein
MFARKKEILPKICKKKSQNEKKRDMDKKKKSWTT